MSKRKIQVLSLSDKLKIVNAFECGKSRYEIQTEFGVPESTYYKIIKSKDSIKSQCSEGHGNIKRSRLSLFPDIENCLLIWIKQILGRGIPLDGPLLKQKAKDFATKLGVENFSASNGWLEGFKRRHDIAFKDFIHVDDYRATAGEFDDDDIVHNYVRTSKDGNVSEDEASRPHTVDTEVENIPNKQEVLEALEKIHKFFEYSAVVDQTIYDKIHELEMHVHNVKTVTEI